MKGELVQICYAPEKGMENLVIAPRSEVSKLIRLSKNGKLLVDDGILTVKGLIKDVECHFKSSIPFPNCSLLYQIIYESYDGSTPINFFIEDIIKDIKFGNLNVNCENEECHRCLELLRKAKVYDISPDEIEIVTPTFKIRILNPVGIAYTIGSEGDVAKMLEFSNKDLLLDWERYWEILKSTEYDKFIVGSKDFGILQKGTFISEESESEELRCNYPKFVIYDHGKIKPIDVKLRDCEPVKFSYCGDICYIIEVDFIKGVSITPVPFISAVDL